MNVSVFLDDFFDLRIIETIQTEEFIFIKILFLLIADLYSGILLIAGEKMNREQ